MADVVESVTIACSPERVWGALADLDAISRWAPGVAHSSLTTEAGHGVGAERRVQVGRNAFLERVTEWEPGRRLSYTIDGLPAVVRSVTNSWELEGSDGSTTVTVVSRIDAGPRPPQQVIARVVGRTLAKTSREMLAGLKAHVERIEAA